MNAAINIIIYLLQPTERETELYEFDVDRDRITVLFNSTKFFFHVFLMILIFMYRRFSTCASEYILLRLPKQNLKINAAEVNMS